MSYLEFINTFPVYKFLKPLFEKGLIPYKTWSKGEIVFPFNVNLSSICFFTGGRGKAYRVLHNGKEVLYSTYGKGYIAGDLEYITKLETTCNIISQDNLSGFILPYNLIGSEYHSKLFELFSKEVSKKFIINSTESSIKLGYNLEERVAYYCLYKYDNYISSMEELSGILGTTYRHLSRVFKKFSDKGLLTIENRRITILNRRELENLSTSIKEEFLVEKIF